MHGHGGRCTRDELQLQPAVCCRQQFHLTLTAVEDSRRPALYASAATSTARPTTTLYAVYGEPARDFFHARRLRQRRCAFRRRQKAVMIRPNTSQFHNVHSAHTTTRPTAATAAVAFGAEVRAPRRSRHCTHPHSTAGHCAHCVESAAVRCAACGHAFGSTSTSSPCACRCQHQRFVTTRVLFWPSCLARSRISSLCRVGAQVPHSLGQTNAASQVTTRPRNRHDCARVHIQGYTSPGNSFPVIGS